MHCEEASASNAVMIVQNLQLACWHPSDHTRQNPISCWSFAFFSGWFCSGLSSIHFLFWKSNYWISVLYSVFKPNVTTTSCRLWWQKLYVCEEVELDMGVLMPWSTVEPYIIFEFERASSEVKSTPSYHHCWFFYVSKKHWWLHSRKVMLQLSLQVCPHISSERNSVVCDFKSCLMLICCL